ncbi:MAG: DNA alkylation repair protein [Patescibacteria group bacterium]
MLRKEIRALADSRQAKILQRFFKTGKGEYGEGDVFLGLMVPQSRTLAQKYKTLSFTDIEKLLRSAIHEERFIALLILVHRFQSGIDDQQARIFRYYLRSTGMINNWDLVDLTAPAIVGRYLFDTSRAVLQKLARSKNVWERRIAIVATYYFIRNDQFVDTLRISRVLLHDGHDLIHKAVGWMLREVGKKNKPTLVRFLKAHHTTMPRTMLRYAIEKFPERERRGYLAA